jgi:hypothetical protein
MCGVWRCVWLEDTMSAYKGNRTLATAREREINTSGIGVEVR